MTDMGKKRISGALFAAALCLGLTVPVLASNRVTEIAVDVTLRPDGSAYVTQTWSGDFDEGTECYFPVTNLGDVTLENLQVFDETGSYALKDPWDTGASFAEKARACGLNPVDDGYEVCWGISEYGENRYAVEYELGGLVGGYDDFDGFNFQFVPSNMNTGPTDVTVRIQTQDGTPLNGGNAGIWAFGFEGQIGFQDGGVLAYTDAPLTEDNSVIVMLQLNKGVLTPARTVPGSFEDVKTRALEGSDYGLDSGEDNEGVGFLLAVGLIVIAAAVVLVRLKSPKRKLKKVYKGADYWREAPIGGNLEASFVLADRFFQTDDDGNLIAATLTRLLADRCLAPETEIDTGFLGREKKSVSLRLVKPPTKGVAAIRLYELLTLAAGSDGVLQEQELERYCKTNYAALLDVVQEAKRDGGETLAGIGCYKSLLSVNSLPGLTDRGRTLLLQLMGYKKYLLDFSLIAERGTNEALVWQDCMTYAALLGIGQQALKELRKLYPGVNAQMQTAERTYYMAYRYNMVTYRAAKNAESSAQRSSGGGGFSSLGGGGGFSGGGSGGGTR